MLFSNSQLVLPLMLPPHTSAPTPVVFSPIMLSVELPQTTLLLLLVGVKRTVLNSGTSKTPGVPGGVMKVMSSLPSSTVLVLAVARHNLSTPSLT